MTGGQFGPLAYDVVYLDGSNETVRANMRARTEVERRWPQGHDVTNDGHLVVRPFPPALGASLLVAWWSLGQPSGDLDAWSETVESIKEVDHSADPSLPAPGDD